MRLLIHSDASYHSEPEARSRAAGYHYLGDDGADGLLAPPNGAILVLSTVIKGVAASVGEAEYITAFINAQLGVPERNALAFIGHKQAATPLTCDNQCAVGLANNTVKQVRSKAIDMKYHWVRYQVQQKQFWLRWQKGVENLADFFSKAHPVHHVRSHTPLFLAPAPVNLLPVQLPTQPEVNQLPRYSPEGVLD
jgi:hypothetical protein